MMQTATCSDKLHQVLATGLVLALAIVLLVNAWIVDDAYITFRTVDNFVNGRGLTWNLDERVQAYSHPLWMFVISLCYMFTSEFFFTVIVLSFLLTIVSVVIVWVAVTDGFRQFLWKGPLFFLILISSKAVIDYASSGLENPLSYLVASIFLTKFMSVNFDGHQNNVKDISILFFIASQAFLNRPDTVLLYLPALLYLLYISRHLLNWHLFGLILLATLPATLWILFSLVYYGYPFPNTAYAKTLSTGFPFTWKLIRGLEYLANSVLWDTVSYVVLGSAAVFSLRSKSPAQLCAMAGIALYMLYVVGSAASATHMSGRFLSVPIFMAIIVFLSGVSNPRLGFIACVCLVVYISWSPISAIKFGTSAYRPYRQHSSYIDTKWYVANEGAALINWRPDTRMPNHPWFHYGEELRQHPDNVHVGGNGVGSEAIGYAAFAAGPQKHFVDILGLGDPLLARLPAQQPSSIRQWKSAHFRRSIPVGYVEGLATGENLIQGRNMKRYYDLVRTITRGPIFDVSRFLIIVNMNLGKYDYLLDDTEVEPRDSVRDLVPKN